MDVAIVLEKFYGLWFFIIGCSLLTAGREWKKLLAAWIKNPEQLKMFAIIMLPLGLFTILLHNTWIGISIAVTLIGWVMSLELAIFMCFPNIFSKIASNIIHNKNIFYVGSILYILIGILILVGAFL